MHYDKAKGKGKGSMVFLTEGQSAAGWGEPHDRSGEIGEVARRQPEVGQRISPMAVEAGRDDHPGGDEGLDGLRQHLVQRRSIGVTRGPWWEGKIDGRAHPWPLPRLLEPTGARIERELVHRDVQHPRVRVEGGLRAVAVVGVPIDDDDALASMGEDGGSDGHVVEQTEAHRPDGGGVMSGRAHGQKGRVGFAAVESLDGLDPGTGGHRRCPPRALARDRVGIEGATAGPTEPLHGVEVLRRVSGLQLGPGGGPGREGHEEVDQVGLLDPPGDGSQPSRSLGMTDTGVVFQIGGVGTEKDGHAVEVIGRNRRCSLRRPRLLTPSVGSEAR